MKDFRNRLVLVTGAASGIGQQTAIAFAREGAHIIATDLNEVALAATRQQIEQAGGHCDTLTADVADPDAMRGLADTVHERFGALDLLVNNAGIGASGRFIESDPDTWDRVWAVNVKGVMLGCKLFLPPMLERGSGHIVNLASMAGYFPSPELPIYSASKFAVLGFSEALRADIKDQGIGVTAVCPGVVNTNIVATTRAEGASAAWQNDAVAFYQKRNYSPERVAAAIVGAVRRNAAVLPVTPEAWALYYAKRWLPGLTRRLAAQPLPFMKQP